VGSADHCVAGSKTQIIDSVGNDDLGMNGGNDNLGMKPTKRRSR
jgi:hypothetical protein